MNAEPWILTVGKDCNALAAQDFIKSEIPTYRQFRLRPYERVIMVRIERDRSRASVLVETFIVRESARSTTFIKRGRKLVAFTRRADGYYNEEYDPIIMWDDDFVTTEHRNIGRVETGAETRARREWEADAYRVGTSKNPLDNAARTADAFAHPTMTKYWSA